MHLTKDLRLVIATALCFATIVHSLNLGPSTFIVPGPFPTSVYKSYYNNPTQTSEQVQPVITDPITVCLFFILKFTLFSDLFKERI